MFPKVRPRFAPWGGEVTSHFNGTRFTLTGYPGETKEFILTLKLSTDDHGNLTTVLRHAGQSKSS